MSSLELRVIMAGEIEEGAITRSDLTLIVGGLVDAVRDQDPEHIARLMAADVVWEGVRPGLRCDGREDAMGVIRRRFAAGPLLVDAMEAMAGTEGVLVSLAGPGFNGTPGDLETVGRIHHVFTVRGGTIVRWRDFLDRRAALAAAGIRGSPEAPDAVPSC